MADTTRHLMIAAGGTGGHMFPAQALSEVMLRKGWRVTLSTDVRGARYVDGYSHAVEIRQVSSASFSQGSRLSRLIAPFRILSGIIAATRSMRRDRPSAVVGFGGYPTIPALAAAWLTRTPSMIHEQNAVLGRVNRLFARRVRLVACGLPLQPPLSGITTRDTGNPVRRAVKALAAAPYRAPETGTIELLIFGGSQGASVFAAALPAALAQLPAPLQSRLRVVQQVRAGELDAVKAAYDALNIPCDVAPFFRDIAERIAAAHLVICRAGASSVADLAVIGRPSVLVPFPHAAADHQTANARGLVESGGAQMLIERDLTPDTLAIQIKTLLTNPDRLATMAKAAAEAGRPDAADQLAALIEQIARKETP